MTDTPNWGPTLNATKQVPGRGAGNSKIGLREVQEWQDFQQARTGADVAVAMGGVDTGDGFDGWGFVTEVVGDIGTGISNAVTGTVNTISAIVQGFTGMIGNWVFGDVEAAARAVAQQAADTAASVAKLQQLNSANAQGGNSGFVDFSSVADGSSLGSSFTQYYSGSGTDLFGVVGGRGSITPGTNMVGRTCQYVYNTKQTLTDLQRVSAVFSTSVGVRFGPFFAPFTVEAVNSLRARVAESGTYAGVDCVQVLFTHNTLYLGCVVSGVWTQWAAVGHAFRPGAIYSLDAGSLGGDRQYRVQANGATIYLHNEVGTASHKGSGYRATGGGAEWRVGYDGFNYYPAFPSQVAAFYMADNTTPTLLSSLGRAFRTSATTVSFPTVNTYYNLPAGFFDTLDYSTPDMVWDGTAGSWTVTRRANYIVSVMLATNNTAMSGVPNLMVNGASVARGNTGILSTLIYVSPMNPGDVLTLRYQTATASVQLWGSVDGSSTYFQIARITPDNLEDISA